MKTFCMCSALALLATVSVGCVSNPYVTSVEPNDVRDVDSRAAVGTCVPAGTPFVARVDVALDTLRLRNGTPFTAHTVGPLVATDGRVLVPANAVLRGTLVSVGVPASPRLRLDFQTIDTVTGQSRIHAAVVNADVVLYAGRSWVEPIAAPTFQDGYVYSLDFEQYGVAETPRSGRSGNADGYELVTPEEVRIPRFAKLDLVLTRALMPPGPSGGETN